MTKIIQITAIPHGFNGDYKTLYGLDDEGNTYALYADEGPWHKLPPLPPQ